MNSAPRLLWLLLALWAIAFFGAFAVYGLTEPSGSGFTRGMNRAGGFLTWQAAAVGLAIVLWWRARRSALPNAVAWLMRLPVFIAMLMAAAIVALVIFGVVSSQRGL